MPAVLRPAVVFIAAFTLLTGVAYPLAVTGIAQVVFPNQANGSPIVRDGVVVGSTLVGQAFSSDHYFHGRPSAAGSAGYDASASSGSNLGPLSAKLLDRIKGDAAELRAQGFTSIPADAVTASASGLDPDISPAFAALQAARVAKSRGVAPDRVEALVAAQIQRHGFGFASEPRVNVLLLNLALDAAFGEVSG
jgi:potassium-transporting ATPase KdpC subunit